MGRGLFYLGIGAIAAYAIYLLVSADDQDDHPPRHSQSRESSRPPVLRQQHQQIIDSPQRSNHAPVEAFQPSLRFKVKQEDDFIPQYHRQTKEYHDHARAKALSEEAKRYPFETEKPNAEASAAILDRNNRDRQVIGSLQRPDCAPVEVVQASLRAKAKQGDSTVQFHRQIKERRDYARAKTPLEEGKRHTFEVEYPSAEASVAIFSENSQDRQIIDSSQRPTEVIQASLRAKAKQEAVLMSQYYQQSHDAYECRDHARAKALSEEAKRHALKVEELNAEASAAIFNENNQDRTPSEVDLHRLYVKEAIAYSEKAITDARRRGDPEVRLIVGKGNHSDRNVPRLKPKIRENMEARGYCIEVDPMNEGVLVVQLSDEC